MRRESKSDTRAMENHIVQLKNKEQNTFTGMLVIIGLFVGICLYFVLADNKRPKDDSSSDLHSTPKVNQHLDKLKDNDTKQVNRSPK